MSVGSKIVPVRIEDELLEKMYVACNSRNIHKPDDPDSVSRWVRRCITEKLDHLARSRKRKEAGKYRCVECGNNFKSKDEVRQAYDGDTLVVSQCIYCIAEQRALQSYPIDEPMKDGTERLQQ